MSDYIAEFIINIWVSFLFLILANGKLNRRSFRYSYLLQILSVLVLAECALLLDVMQAPVIIKSLTILLVLHYLYTCIFFTFQISNLFWVVIFCIVELASKFTATIFPVEWLHTDADGMLTDYAVQSPVTILYLLTLTVLTSILLCFSSRAFKLSRTEKIIFVLLSVLCIVIENLIVAGQVNIHTGSPETYADLLSAICFLILILFVSLTIYLYHLGIEREKNIQLSRQQLLSEMERKQYDQIISSISELRYLKHDISNHLDTLHALMVNHAYPEAEAFIRDLTATVNNNHYILASGNSTVDSILTNKLIQCKSAQIQVEYSVFLPDSIPLSDIELCSLLGNLFDNAIEACEQLPETEQRSIDFSMKPFQNMLFIAISNRTNGYYRIDKKNHFLSTKTIEDTPEHGLGLSRIQSIVNDHNGIFNIQPTTDTFMIQILLPLK